MRLRWDRTSFLASDLPHHRPDYVCGRTVGLYDSSLWTGRGHWTGWRFDPPLSWVLWRKWWWGAKSWIRKRPFRCRVCGVQCNVAPLDSGILRSTAVCEEHCPEHDYEYDRDVHGRTCMICGKPEPYDARG